MVWEIALIILLLVASVFIILLIPTILELRKTLSRITTLANNLNSELPEILTNVTRITEHVNSASDKINYAVDDLVEVEKKITREVKKPALEAAASIAAFLQGIQTFLNYMMQKK